MPRTLIAFAVAAVVLAGCREQAPDPTPSTSLQTSSTEKPAPSRSSERVVVPRVVGSMQRPATRMLRDGGFALEVVRRNACPAGVVVAQRPTGRAPRGSTVRLVVLDPVTMSCARSPAIAPAQQLVSWAQGGEAAPEFADTVDLLLGNGPVLTLTAPLDRDAWGMCEPYAERDCLNPLMIKQGLRFGVRTVPPGATYCPDRVQALPTRLVERVWSSTTLVAKLAEDDACMATAALQVWVDDDNRIEAVNLLLGSP